MTEDDDDPIARLAQEGRSLLAEDDARKASVAAAETGDAGRDKRRLIRNSVSQFARWGWWFGGAVIGVGLGAVVVTVLARHFAHGADGDDWPVGVASLVVFVPPVILFFFRPFFGALAVAQEEAWVRRLPFKLVGYFDALGNSRNEGTAALTVRFRTGETTTPNPDASFRTPGAVRATTPDAPDDDTLRALSRTVGASLDKSRDDGHTKRIIYKADFGDSSVSTNAHLAAWVHRAARMLEALHAKHPIENVRVDGFD